ncbi:thioredoxin family protein [Robertmurraya korlensis]|uniref:glutaredoxin family protein n=1 Tax=Robertmurraya korlensis TaxID=519977 RepID=UPI00203B1060|nr:glutaredoxin domain-containing protein [Robertmurraya korlensis]MCM3600372.1 thioredoxin family protein [Robertmurraya korlensis]
MNKVTLYTQPGCPPCEFTKNFFTDQNISYEVKDIKKDSSARDELIKLGSYSTPTIVINGDVIIGFEQERILKALGLSNKNE